MVAADQLTGTLIAGRYRLSAIAGTGGFSYVYRAEQVGLGRLVAVKLMRGERQSIDPELFRREAQTASRINHPNAVAIFDYGVTDDGIPFLVMEWLRGRTLSEIVAEGPLSLGRIGNITDQVLRAVGEAHSCNVIHRDLKAENVLIQQLRAGEDFAKVIDFGVARVLGAEKVNLGVVGTPEYMAPEQIRNEEVGPRTDLYAIGIMLYELIVGRTPFAGGNISEVLTRQLTDEVTPPHELSPRCPVAVSQLIVRALSKNPADRPDSADEMASLLAEALAGPSTIDCPRCNCTQSTNNRFCSECGAQLSEAPRGTVIGLGDAAARVDLDAPNKQTPPRRMSTASPERESEIGEVQAFVRGALPGPALAVVGPPGSGRKKLLLHAIKRVATDRVVLVVGPDPSGLSESWYPIMSLLGAALSLPAAPSADDLSLAIARAGLPERDLPGLCEVFDTPGPLESAEIAVRQREAFAAARRVIEAIDHRYPGAVICLLDIDQYDRPSLQLIEALCQSLDGSGVRLVMTSENADVIPPGSSSMVLEGMSEDAIIAIASQAAGRFLTSDESEQVLARSAGVPALAHQLGMWVREGGLWEQLPESAVDMLALRVTHLDQRERKALQALALLGTRSDEATLEQLVGADAPAAVDALCSQGFAARDDGEVVISRALAEIVFESMPLEARRELHALCTALDGIPLLRMAHHAMGSGDAERAYELYMAAGDSAVRRFDDPGATRCYGQAIQAARQVLASGDLEKGSVWFVDASVCLADTQRFTGEFAMAKSVLAEATEVDWDKSSAGLITRSQARVLAASGDLQTARLMYVRCIGLAMQSGDRDFLCESYVDLAGVLAQLGDFKQATSELAEALDVVTLGDDLAKIDGISKLWLLAFRLAEIQLHAGDHDKAEQIALQALGQARRSQARQAPGRCLALLARIAEKCGNSSKALSYRTLAIDELRQVGDRRSTAKLILENARATLQVSPLSSDDTAGARLKAQRLEVLAMDLAREVTGTQHTSFTPPNMKKPTRPRTEDDTD